MKDTRSGTDVPLSDESVDVEVHERSTVYRGAVWDVVRESFDLPEAGGALTRDVLAHTGAVAVAAIDDEDRVLLIRQYRHPIRMRDWEVPAGLRDIDGEDPAVAAARELGEEADIRAEEWHTLADMYTTPGGSTEIIRIYLARGIDALPHAQRTDRVGEERGIVVRWTPLAEAVDAVLAGSIGNATACLAILHADRARERGWTDLRPVDAPWPGSRV
ncbi:NUDIX domain-containing protein [Brevibacterium jeotgali]|uniref:NUDIX domain-containing protein n=1 Tax=Brevibacterium jeotgali TaxID=1262550 RepID=UPI001FE6ABEC|nr:NUDIX hydrolase [Brevibacterium jeotgali]